MTGGRLRIAYVDHCARLSGAEIALLRLIESLAEVDAHVILGEDGPLVGSLREVGATVTVLPLHGSVASARREASIGFDTATGVVRDAVALARLLRRMRPDALHLNSLKAYTYGTVAARLARVPTLWHVHDRLARRTGLGAGTLALLRALLAVGADSVVANSWSTRATLGRVPRRVRVTVVPPAYRPRSEPAPLRPEVARVGIVGRLAPWKGQDVFLDAFAEAFAHSRVEACVIGAPLFDRDHDFARGLVGQAARLGITDRVEFRGFRSDMEAELARLDVLVHASVDPEPFGQVVVEGLAAGVPVVAAADGGPTEILTADVNGLLTPPGAVPALAAALRRLATDSELRARLRTAGLARARAFDPDVAARRVRECYATLSAGRRDRP